VSAGGTGGLEPRVFGIMDGDRRNPGIERVAAAAWRAAALALLAALGGCEQVESVLERVVEPRTPRESYVASLAAAGLEGSVLVARWRQAADVALAQPVEVDPPFEDISFYPAEEPTAVGYVLSLSRGQALHVTFATEPAGAAGVFLDVFRVAEDGSMTHVASADEGATELEFEPVRTGTFVLRVQPEMLATVRVRLSLLRAATLAFPVVGQDPTAAQSRFGAPREGGRRAHEGVDIFAARGTPVIAAADGIVRRVGTQRLGGLVVWLRDDERGYSHYYAHLSAQLVERGARVRAGDTLGLVGNTGNARTTPPHLHFGLYRRGEGALDPWPFLAPQPARPPALVADTARLGEWVRIRSEERAIFAAAAVETRLPAFTVVRVVGAHDRRLRVRLPDGRVATLASPGLASLDTPIDRMRVAAGAAVLDTPVADALTRGRVTDPATLDVVGRFERYLLVRSAPGIAGWIAGPD